MTEHDPDTETTPAPDGPGHDPIHRYEIRVQGRLAARWAAWFDGLEVTDAGDGTTVLAGPVVDDAALHGVLQKLRDIGVPLLSLTQLPDDTTRTERL
ncbi:MAG: hypothetical protein KDB37_00615 [Ilumatobacter sp.]|nr:hypothetical protein [Ilumatobacter sp.]